MKKNLFSKKIKYLFETLNLGEEELVKLFWNGIKPSYGVRKKSVIDKWYNKDILNPKAFHFDTYPISKLNQNGKPFFSKDAFLYEEFSDFKKKVDRYSAYTTQPKNSFDYKYIYYYDINLKKVTHLKLYTIEEIDNSKYRVKMLISTLYTEKEIDNYEGELNIINDYYHLTLKNNFEIVTFYFMLNKGFRNNSAIYGLRLGLSYDKGLPISGKNLLSKKLLSAEDEELFYLNASECDTLVSHESTFNIYDSMKQNYLEKIHSKISDIALYIEKSKKILHQSINKDIYINIFFSGLGSLYNISNKVEKNQTFFTSRRRNAKNIFIKKLIYSKNSSCIFVYPIFSKDTTLFHSEDTLSKGTLNIIVDSIKKGISIEMIIMITPNYVITEYEKESIAKLINIGANIRICSTDIDTSVSSYDFIYNSSKEVAIYRNIGDRICYFKVTNNQDSINNLSYNFEIIKKNSYSFDDFIAQKHIKLDDSRLKALVGTWYVYSYGSIKKEDKTKIWEIRYQIDSKKNIKCYIGDELRYTGRLTLQLNHKSYIVLTSNNSYNITFITFHNKDMYKKIFKISMIFSQLSIDKDMTTFGLFSKVKLDLDKVRKTLGDDEQITLKESHLLEERVKKLLELYIL